MSKNFRIEPVAGTTLVKIAFEGGGEVPDDLKGTFTNITVAKQFIYNWQQANPDRVQEEPRVVARDEDKARPKPKTMEHV